jgi:HSP20 family molecular chaperone IbpA
VLGHDGILKVIIPKEGKKGEKVHKVETHWGVDPGPMSKIGIHPVDHTLHMPGPLSRWHWNFWPWSHHSQPQTPSEGVKCTKEKFMVHLEVPQFYEGEISVKTLDDFLVVEGTHESRKDGQGFVSRQFKCQYLLPLNANRNELRAEMNEVGLLTVTIPRTQGSQDEKAYQISYSQAPKLKN